MSDPVAQLIFLLIKAILMPVLIILIVAFTIFFERKFAGFFQGRVGPTYLGPWGSFQSFGDILKLLSKEDVTPLRADKRVFRLAPYIAFVPAFLVMAVLPFGPVGGEPNLFGHRFDWVIANFDSGIVLFLAMGAIAVYGFVLAGWSSNNNFSLLGGLRAGAQMISYELAMGFAVVGVILMAGSMSLVDVVDAQKGAFWDWYFYPQIVGGLIFFIASIAELNRTPFDLAEAEQELVAGHLTEYSGMRWGMFMFAEYVNMVVISAIVSTLYFGGWRAPFESWNVIPGPVWLFAKVFVFMFLYIWVRWTIFRYRYNQLMSIGWKVLLPLSLANLVVTAIVVSVVNYMGLIDVIKKGAFVDILRGMSVTGTYFVVDKVTVEYPKEKLQTYPRFRGVQALLTDPETGDTKCVACMLCATICPSRCISIVGEQTPEGRSHPASFDLDLSRCIFCGLCEEVCPEAAIVMTRHYELATFDKNDFYLDKEKLLANQVYAHKELFALPADGVAPTATAAPAAGGAAAPGVKDGRP